MNAVGDVLDEAIPSTSDGAKTNAAELLRNHDADVAEVIRIDADLISYRDSAGRPMSAWLRVVGPVTRVALEVGWPGEPSAGSLRTLDTPSGGLVIAQQIESD